MALGSGVWGIVGLWVACGFACASVVVCTLYSVHCTLYTVHCTLYTVHCTVYVSVYVLLSLSVQECISVLMDA